MAVNVSGGGAAGGTPAPVLSTSNAAGAAGTFLRTDDQLAIFDATNPSTQAFGDAAVVGVVAAAARRDHKHAMPAAPAAAGITHAGSNLTEATTTSTTPVNLLTTSGLSIGASVPLYAVAQLRKSTGAANTATAAATANATTFGGSAWSTNANAAEAGFWHLKVQTAQANYDGGGPLIMGTSDAVALTTLRVGGAWPVATLTSLAVRAWVGDALITMGADEMHVYTFAVS